MKPELAELRSEARDDYRGERRGETHREGIIARTIEQQTAKLPSDTWLWAAFGSIGVSLFFQMTGDERKANFVGHWAPTFLLLGLYNKLVKLLGSERAQ
ncbi:MAG TPA: hypothetical protein VH351_08735 [Bryobacteraceae bacterium]|jgi:hypothetical protein|nr:hypothetical protein [Bryobacteraceae bacterium]